MTDQPTPDEAARALQAVEQDRNSSLGSMRQSRWVYVVGGLAVFLLLALPDVAGDGVTAWTGWVFALLSVGYSLMLRSPKGAALLGRSTRPRVKEASPAFVRYARVAIVVLLALGIVASFLPHPVVSVPYFRTGLGVILGGALIFFGPQLQSGLSGLATRKAGVDHGGLHGLR